MAYMRKYNETHARIETHTHKDANMPADANEDGDDNNEHAYTHAYTCACLRDAYNAPQQTSAVQPPTHEHHSGANVAVAWTKLNGRGGYR